MSPSSRPAPSSAELRRGVLRAAVLHDVDVNLTTRGISLPPTVAGTRAVPVTWAVLREALATRPGSPDPDSGPGAWVLANWLRQRRWVADEPVSHLLESLRPVGLPVGHVLHPGAEWVALRVLGDVLDVGLGVAALDPAQPDAVELVAPSVWRHARLDPMSRWPQAAHLLTRMGALAAARWREDPRGRLGPMGDCDAVTLLASRTLREALAGSDAGMRAVAMPMRRRGWTAMSYLDPAFAPAAAAATEPDQRGFPRPLLVTHDEVVMVAAGGRPGLIALADPPREDVWRRDVLYR